MTFSDIESALRRYFAKDGYKQELTYALSRDIEEVKAVADKSVIIIIKSFIPMDYSSDGWTSGMGRYDLEVILKNNKGVNMVTETADLVRGTESHFDINGANCVLSYRGSEFLKLDSNLISSSKWELGIV